MGRCNTEDGRCSRPVSNDEKGLQIAEDCDALIKRDYWMSVRYFWLV